MALQPFLLKDPSPKSEFSGDPRPYSYERPLQSVVLYELRAANTETLLTILSITSWSGAGYAKMEYLLRFGTCLSSDILRNRTFRKRNCFCTREKWDIPTPVGELERANLNHWNAGQCPSPSNSKCYTESSKPLKMKRKNVRGRQRVLRLGSSHSHPFFHPFPQSS